MLGPLITLEGLDFSGKSTVIESLKKHADVLLFQTYFTREPGGSKKGQEIRDYLTKHALELTPQQKFYYFQKDRKSHLKEVIVPKRKHGLAVISDRYVGSTYAYQVAGDGLNFNYVDNHIQTMFEKEPLSKPDLTIYLKVSPQVRQERMTLRQSDALDHYNPDFYERVENAYLKGIQASSNKTITINADQSANLVAEEVFAQIQRFMLNYFLQHSSEKE